MSLLFGGCSITYGDELQDRVNERFSTLVGEHYSTQAVNLGVKGVSNDHITRKTIQYLENFAASIVIIQFTVHQRIEWFDETGKEHRFTPQKTDTDVKKIYYRDVYTNQLGVENLWKNVFLFDSYCRSRGQKYIPLIEDHYDDALRHPEWLFENGMGNWGKLCREIPHTFLNCECLGLMKRYPQHYINGARGGHPTALGHQVIAKKVIELIDHI